MMKEKYETLPLTTLKELAKARGLKGISTMKKAQVIELMLQEDEKEQEKEKQEKRETVKEMSANTGDKEIHDIDRLDSGIVARGILEVMPDGFGFIRSDNYLPEFRVQQFHCPGGQYHGFLYHRYSQTSLLLSHAFPVFLFPVLFHLPVTSIRLPGPFSL